MSGATDALSNSWNSPVIAWDWLSGNKQKREDAQNLLDKQSALDKARHDANVALATKQAALQKSTAQGQYDLAQTNENTKFQVDDQAQLDAINKAVQDPSLSLDAKLALIDSQVKAGLGTESAKLALNARLLAQQEFDLNGVGGARDIQQRQLDSQIQAGRGNILSMVQQRDAGLAEGANVSSALGLSGTGVERQVGAQTYGADSQIQAQALNAGFVLDQTPGELAAMSVFDRALQTSLTGRNLKTDAFAANVRSSQTQLDTAVTGFGFDVYGLGAADTAFRASADFGLKTNNANADLGLEGAISGADFSFQQSQINTEGQQYKIDQASNLDLNFLQGISQVALWASNPAVGAAATGFSKWWGSMSQPTVKNEAGAGWGNSAYD